jgi:hypothetical protein
MAGQIQWRGPTIITDGLLFYMNSSSPSCYNTSSFFGGGSTLRNISGFTSYSGSMIGNVASELDSTYTGGRVFRFPDGTPRPSISLGNPPELLFGTNSFTISVWIKTYNANSFRIILNKRKDPQSSPLADRPYLWLSAGRIEDSSGNIAGSQQLTFSIKSNQTNQYTFYTTDNVMDGNWKHVTVVRDSLAAVPFIKMYVNNIEQAQTSPVGGIVGTGVLTSLVDTSDWTIGNLSPSLSISNFAWERPMSSVQIYNRALSTDELTFNYNNSKALYGL